MYRQAIGALFKGKWNSIWAEGHCCEFTLPPRFSQLVAGFQLARKYIYIYCMYLFWFRRKASYVTNSNTACVLMSVQADCVWNSQSHMIIRAQQGIVMSPFSLTFSLSLFNLHLLCACFSPHFLFPPSLSIYPTHLEHRPLSILISHSPSRCPTYLVAVGWASYCRLETEKQTRTKKKKWEAILVAGRDGREEDRLDWPAWILMFTTTPNKMKIWA